MKKAITIPPEAAAILPYIQLQETIQNSKACAGPYKLYKHYFNKPQSAD